ncbi:hypothetical protein CWI75_10710 [Kineobactrum sediminis]|uniref:Uncharacterized protein n=1 Tax=Kineobactrum sediminis TaxID=1905677 RepID=A0A2N5Y1G7_9GAMM|nr:hypothetical protein [Kineobactrum sediminis]PLW82241.1 hypothetical protein CWI75_10710 [Kineobactrum sediminis]
MKPDQSPIIEEIDGFRVWAYFEMKIDGKPQLFAWTLSDILLAGPIKSTERGFWRAGTWFASMLEIEEGLEEERGFLGPAQGRVLKLADHLFMHGDSVELEAIH